MNRTEITGKIIELGTLRYTPAGIPAVDFKLQHESELEEAGKTRKVQAEIGAVAFEALARLIAGAQLGKQAKLAGFLGTRSKRSKRLVLHVTHIEFIEGA